MGKEVTLGGIEQIIKHKLMFQGDHWTWKGWDAAIEQAARAIAEKMREGVAWEGPARVGKYCNIELISGVSGEEYGLFQPWPHGQIENAPIGQLVNVTVTKAEEK